MEMTNLTRTTLPNIKVNRFKGKRQYPSIPNQPSEASAHFMFELAKTVIIIIIYPPCPGRIPGKQR